jgi:hypothetical protein
MGMVMSDREFHNWKCAQIAYFRKYLEGFNEGTEEHRIIRNGISELEKTL